MRYIAGKIKTLAMLLLIVVDVAADGGYGAGFIVVEKSDAASAFGAWRPSLDAEFERK